MVGSAFIFSSIFVLGGAKIFESDWVVGFYVLIVTFSIALIAACMMRNPKKKRDIAFIEDNEDENQEIEDNHLMKSDD